nr:SH3-like domain-containing protein [Lacticaseibacillus porcinae]
MSSKTLSGVMQIDQTNRKDGIYTSGPYNTSSATAAINTDGVKYNGQVVQELKQAVTPHSTYVQVKTTTGATFWIDIHALKTPTSDPVLESKSQDYYAVIDQSSRRDGVYLNGPYRTATGTYWPNTDGTKYDQQFVHVIKTERTKWSTYAQVVGDNNKTFWIDIHALKTPTYYPITSQKNVSYDVQIDESLHKNGVVDGIYESGPYRTSAETYRVNTDSKKYDGQYGHVDKEATNANSTYAHVKLLSGTSFWIDIHGLKKPSYDKILNQQNVDYDAKIDEAARPNGIVDGVYASGPYRTSLATSPINYDGKKYDQQNGHVDKLATTVNSTYAHIKLNSGTAFWIDVHALKKLTYDKILNSQNVNYDAKIDEAARPNGVVDGVYASGPYRTSLATSEINYDGKKYDQQNGHVDKLATTANSTYAHITLTSGTAFWIDVHALKKLSFDQVLKSQDVSYDAKIDELARPNGVVDGVYSSGPYRTSLATAAINYDGKKYDQQVGHVDKLATTVNSTYVHITLTTGTAFWIDSHAVQKLVYYPITSRKQVNYTAVIDESLHKNGVIDGIYTSGPYRTSLDTFEINTDSKLYDGQIVWVTEEATNAQSTYAHVTLTNGKRFWIDIHGLRR